MEEQGVVGGNEQVSTKKSRKARWLVWTGSATLLGLFAAGLAHDLSHERPNRADPPLPFFPDAP